MLRSLALLLLLPLPLFFTVQDEAPPEAEAVQLLACASCSGSGKHKITCETCTGERRIDCSYCGPPVQRIDSFAIRRAQAEEVVRGRLDKDEAASIALMQQEIAETRLEVEAMLGGAGVEPGETSCGFLCGSEAANRKKGTRCKLCKNKGVLSCKPCKGKGELKCPDCSGSAKRSVVCPECLGHQQTLPLTRLSEATAERCPWCTDRPFSECASCEGEGTQKGECSTCWGEKKLACGYCDVRGKLACAGCYGTGTTFHMGKMNWAKCGGCNGRGTKECTHCKKGYRECAPCGGKGKLVQDCLHCEGDELEPCPGCTMHPSLAWSETSERLAKAGRTEVAKAYLNVAMERDGAHGEALLEVFVGSAEEIARLKDEFTLRSKELLQRFEALDE